MRVLPLPFVGLKCALHVLLTPEISWTYRKKEGCRLDNPHTLEKLVKYELEGTQDVLEYQQKTPFITIFNLRTLFTCIIISCSPLNNTLLISRE